MGSSTGPRNRETPRLLDLFCGAGGAAMGYSRAGFDVVGVDIKPQPNYPFEFHQEDVFDYVSDWRGGKYDWHWADAVHASPPCQHYTAYRRTGKVGDYPDLIQAVRYFLNATGLPWVIENVAGAPLDDSVMICASMLDPTATIRRHRLFETNWNLEPPWVPCRHRLQASKLYPGGRSKERTGTSRGRVRSTMEIGSWDIPLEEQQEAMGIDWMTLEELSESIPPAYTEFIGSQLRAHLKTGVAA